MGIQDASQIRKDYGREQADVILNTVGNVISGQVTGDSAKQISERIGKTMQDRQSLSINSDDTSISKNKQLEYAVPASRVASLNAGEFVGMVADIPDQRIELKAFHCEIQNNFNAVNREEKAYKPTPVTFEMVQRNYSEIKQEVSDLVETEMEIIRNSPDLEHLLIDDK